ncbi:DegV family protein [Lactiplantibacillus xiangfangensis]|uniref:DegV family protein n=1 Tax=Lactiplantibacillus xiangfangensis TaxID=942150 RepID=A0A0R2MQT6_9LACO|nr:DegV family protein [Lactiplantibacillus xiangfangensis]KRO14523.1 DegV family protein [Lactiplantibacillus xiangfangensis]
MSIKIVTDSAVRLTAAEIEQYNIAVVPLLVGFGSDLIADTAVDPAQFDQQMRVSPSLPTTSQPPIGNFVSIYDALTADGSQVLSLHLTETLSGTVNAARQAAELCDGDVTVIDTQSADRGMAFQVLTAARMAHAGATLDTILAKITVIREHTKTYLFVDTLDNLVKGGRVPKLAGVVTNLIKLKFVFELAEGKLKLYTRGRGKKALIKAQERILAELQDATRVEAAGISYVGDPSVADEPEALLKKVAPQADLMVARTSAVIATHAGIGAYALMFYTVD